MWKPVLWTAIWVCFSLFACWQFSVGNMPSWFVYFIIVFLGIAATSLEWILWAQEGLNKARDELLALYKEKADENDRP